MTTYERLEVSRSSAVAWLVLNRPESGNAFDVAMLDELERAWAELDADPEVRVIVTAANGKAFCTGMDVVQVARDKAAMRVHSRRTRDAELRISSWHCGVWKPVIAAVNGVCAGGGLHLVADADIVIASEAASFVDPHVSVGQAVAYEAITLIRKSPMEAILRMALMGREERMTAQRARQLGIVSQVVPADQLRVTASSLASAIATNSPTAMRATKRALWRALEVGRTTAYGEASDAIDAMADHPDVAEGARALRERRAPVWQPLDVARGAAS
ncbi:enoyl-CoA hydratase/isomerase family protein [Mycolicibacterium sp. 3033]|nr:enoyl-CoA hydratase/isomerase family protein [Mycolicibacterium aurantiacum]